MDIPAHIKQYWRHKWHLSPAQIKALEAQFVADWRWRQTNGQAPEPPAPEPLQPSRRARKMIELNQTLSLKEIAACYDLSQQRISQIFKQAGVKPIRHPYKRGTNV